LLLNVANLLKNFSKKSAKRAIFYLFSGKKQKILIKQHIFRDLSGFLDFRKKLSFKFICSFVLDTKEPKNQGCLIWLKRIIFY